MDHQKPICSFPKCIFTDRWTTCDGRCGRSFHAVCVDLTERDCQVISSSAHILWVCDDCQDLFRRSGSSSRKIPEDDVGGAIIPGQQCSSPACRYTDKFVRCDGECGDSFHAVCVKLPEVDLGIICSKPNLMWLCSGCGDRVRTLHDGKSLENSDENDPNTKLQVLHNHLSSLLGRISGLFPVKMPHDGISFPVKGCEDDVPESSNVSTDESEQIEDVANASEATTIPVQDEGATKDDGEENSAPKPKEKYIFSFGQSTKNVFPNTKDLQLGHAGVLNSPVEKSEFSGFSVAINKKPAPVDTNNNPIFQFQSPKTAATKFEFGKLEGNSPAKSFVFLASPLKQDLVKPPEPVLLKQDPVKPPPEPPTTFVLWLAYFDGDITSEADVDSLVRKQMKLTQLEKLEVIKLGQYRKRVSFKVEMSARLKSLALDYGTWRPLDLEHHREFIEYR